MIPQTFTQAVDKVTSHLQQELGKLRTGRASVSMLDDVIVEAYGSQMKIVEVASISAPDPTLIVISPWDKSLLTAIEKAIFASGLSLSPAVDSEVVRLPVPPLTQEKREEMVKIVYKKLEEAKIMLRNARQDARQTIEETEGVSEDVTEQQLKELDAAQHESNTRLEALAKEKEAALLQI